MLREQSHRAALSPLRFAPFRRAAGWLVNLLVYAAYPRALRHYWLELRRLPNVALPSTYNEKMFWRRVFDRNPAFVAFSDKLQGKALFGGLDGVDVPETLWRGTDPASFPAELRREDVVVKMNSGAGRNWFFAERQEGEKAFARTFGRWLTHKPSQALGEWSYGRVEPAMFAERMVEARHEKLQELKVHLFGGEVFYTVVYVDEKRPGTRSAIFDEGGNRLAVTTSLVERKPETALSMDYCLPATYRQAMAAARVVAKGLDYARVDFMVARGRLFAGEITLYPTAGLMTNSDPRTMAEMGRRWDLRQAWFAATSQRGWRELYRRLLLAEIDAGERPAVGDARQARSATAKLGASP